jgi:mono/diheme cytochrome c family protein
MNRTRDRRSSIHVVLLVSAVVLAMLSIPSAASLAQEETSENPGFLAAKGRVTYRTYCSNCHGKNGTGDGNLAEYLTIPPADLTQISHDNDGVFPREMVHKIIDGRESVPGHGGGEMPIWGDVFQSSLAQDPSPTDEDGEERAQRKIKELVLYLESIQVK